MIQKLSINYAAFIALITVCFFLESLFSINYTISFTSSGASNTVESVLVQNLSKGTTVTVPTGNVLNLTDITTFIDKTYSDFDGISIFPNPISANSTISFFAKKAGLTHIEIYNVDGKKLFGNTFYLGQGINSFQISMPKGVYVVKVVGNGFSYNTKAISLLNIDFKAQIVFVDIEDQNTNKRQKAKSNVTTMLYSSGDLLLYKGISGNYSTIITDKPTESKTTNFEFIECRDGNGNNYTIVKIGTQTWMAENLRASKFRNLENISSVSNNNFWSNTVLSAFCNYNNEISNGLKYGNLYNWYVISDIRNITPIGWHIPSDIEFSTLITNIGGESVAGGKLKESGTQNWAFPNTDASNETGFTALPSGSRNIANNGLFDEAGYSAYWWSSTKKTDNLAYGLGISYDGSYVMKFSSSLSYGSSIRCIKDVVPTLNTLSVNDIQGTTASSGGVITNNGGAPIINCGICWSLTPNPTIEDKKTNNIFTTESFTHTMTELIPNKIHYVRAFATNSAGTAYGNEVIFKTDLKILELYQGGKVAYIFQNGDSGFVEGEVHGLIVSLEDQSIDANWSDSKFKYVGTSMALGSGMSNTLKIVNTIGDGFYAAKFCLDYSVGNHSDWYLPSYEELNKLCGLGVFPNSVYYLSSSEVYNSAYVYCKDLSRCLGKTDSKSSYEKYHVRAIRTF